MKNLFQKKTLVLGSIILLLGLTISPIIMGNPILFKNVISNEDKIITLNQNILPIANFTYEPTEITTGQLIYFNSTSYDPDGTITNWTWNFGDGNTAYDEYTTHTYTDNGIYTVNLTVMDNNSATASIEKNIIINNQPPIAGFTYEPTEITTGQLIYFNSTSYDPDGTITNWTWNFGDGNTAYDEYTTHTYTDNGIYAVNLTVIDDDSAIAFKEKTVTVGNQPPIGDFLYSPATPTVNSTVYFYDTSYDPDGNISAWWWQFGDGYYSNLKNPTHKYLVEGDFIINLTITDDDGAVDSVEKLITILPPNDPPFEPYNPIPPSGMTDVDINITLSWNCSDPDNDQLTYDIYFGNTTPPPKVVDKQTNNSWIPGTLDMETVYYWQIVAYDERNASTAGPVWNFTTMGPPNDPPYGPIITGPDIIIFDRDYTFMFQTIDPDEDYVRYIVTWGDNTEDMTEYIKHDSPVILNHTWVSTASPIMIIRMSATAEDIHGAYSTIIYKWIVVMRSKNAYVINTVPTQNINSNQNNNYQNSHTIQQTVTNTISNSETKNI